MANIAAVTSYQTTLQSGATAVGAGTLMDVGGLAVVNVELSGTWVATVTWEGTITGSTWSAINGVANIATGAQAATATANGVYAVPTAGFSQVRARISAYTSGQLTAIALGVLNGGWTPAVSLTGPLPAGTNVLGSVKTTGLKGYAAQSVSGAGTATNPAGAAAIATMAAPPAGDYEVQVWASYGSVAGPINDMQLQKGATVLGVLQVPALVNLEPTVRLFPRITLDGASALTVNAIAGSAGVYNAQIIATQLAQEPTMPRGLQVLQPPAGEPVTLAEAKNFLRVDIGDDDALILRSIRSGRRHLEETYNRAFVSRRLRTTIDRFPRYSSSAVWQYNSDAIWQQRLPVTQLSGQWYPDRASIRVTRPPMQQLNAITYTDGNGSAQTLIGTIPAGVAAPGSQAVTPASMTGIVVGLAITVDVGTVQEIVTVTAVTAATFTAVFANIHAPYVTLNVVPAAGQALAGGSLVDVDTTTEPARIAPAYGQIWPIVRQRVATVNVDFWCGYGPVTSSAAAIASGTQTVTPVSMAGIFIGTLLKVEPGTVNEETVAVSAITAATFTAAFAQAHNTTPVPLGPDVPDQAKEAILLAVAHRYENREAAAAGTLALVPLGVADLMMGLWPGEYE